MFRMMIYFKTDTTMLFFKDLIPCRNKSEKVEYFIKDMKLANWLKDDIPSMIGADQQLAKGQDIVKGMITVKYSDYLINKKLPDYIFKKKRID